MTMSDRDTVKSTLRNKENTSRISFYIDNILTVLVTKAFWWHWHIHWLNNLLLRHKRILNKLQALADTPLCAAVCTNCFEKCTYSFENVKDDLRRLRKAIILLNHITGIGWRRISITQVFYAWPRSLSLSLSLSLLLQCFAIEYFSQRNIKDVYSFASTAGAFYQIDGSPVEHKLILFSIHFLAALPIWSTIPLALTFSS